MQRRLQIQNHKRHIKRQIYNQDCFVWFNFFLAIFFLDKLEMPVPNKLIKQEISNDKLITLK